MTRSNEDYLLLLWDANVCPNCGMVIPEGTRVGTGRKADGGFCSLDCYARFYQSELKLRARKMAELYEKIKES